MSRQTRLAGCRPFAHSLRAAKTGFSVMDDVANPTKTSCLLPQKVSADGLRVAGRRSSTLGPEKNKIERLLDSAVSLH